MKTHFNACVHTHHFNDILEIINKITVVVLKWKSTH